MPIFNLKRTMGAHSPAGYAINSGSDILSFLTNSSSKYVNADTALQNSDVASIVFQLSSDLADGQLKASQPRAQGILNNPSVTTNAHAFWQSMYAQLLLGGEAYAFRWLNANGTDKYWEYLRPSQVQPYLLDDGSGMIYSISFDEPELGTFEAVPQGRMIHLRLTSRNGGLTGISPLASLASELEIKDKSDKLTLAALARSVLAPGILTIHKGSLLTEKDKSARSRRFMNQINESHSGPIVLDELEDYKPLEIKSNVAQLLNQVSWTSSQIAKAYGVSDAMLNGAGDAQSSIQMVGQQYIKSLSRFARPVESELNNKLNADVTLDLRRSVDPLSDDYATKISALIKNGTITGNQGEYLLKESGYLPDDLPERQETKPNVITLNSPTKGDENEDD